MAALHPEGAQALLSRRSTRYRELGLEGTAFDEGELLDLLAREPKLLRRPLISDGRRLVVGFDQKALEALEGGGDGSAKPAPREEQEREALGAQETGAGARSKSDLLGR
jgi:hypothetical protein